MDHRLELLAARQKLIKIADCSDFGWTVVEEYEADKLTSDSDNEKMLEKAERTAERKAAKRRKPTAGAASRSFYKARRPSAGDIRLYPCPNPLVTRQHTRRPNRIPLGAS